MGVSSPIGFGIIFSVRHRSFPPPQEYCCSTKTDSIATQVVVTSIVVAIIAMLVCMCYMVNVRRRQKELEDVSLEMQVPGMGVKMEGVVRVEGRAMSRVEVLGVKRISTGAQKGKE